MTSNTQDPKEEERKRKKVKSG